MKINKILLFLLLIGVFQIELFAQVDGTISNNCSFPSSCWYNESVFLTTFNICDDNPWTLVFEEDFNGNTLNQSLWKEPPYVGALFNEDSKDQEYNMLRNAIVTEGQLNLTAKNEDIRAKACSWKPEDAILEDGYPNLRDYHYTSAQIWTRPIFQYGFIEAEVKLPKGKGFWPTFWLFCGKDENGLLDGRQYEIDIYEFWNELTNGVFDEGKLSKVQHMNLHRFQTVEGEEYDHMCPEIYFGTDYSEDFHVFAVQWERDRIRWFVDGEIVRELDYAYTLLGQEIGCTINSYTPYICNTLHSTYPMSVIFGFGIQNKDNGIDASPDENTSFPSQHEIKWLRIYQRNPYSSVFVTNQEQYPIQEKLYNTIVGTEVNVNCNYVVPDSTFLGISAENSVTIGPGFHAEPGSYLRIRSDENLFSRNRDGETQKNPSEHIVHSDLGDSSVMENLEVGFDKLVAHQDFKHDGIAIYPNPNNGTFWLLFEENSLDYSIRVCDCYGRMVYSTDCSNSTSIEINLQGFAKGIYSLHIYDKVNNTSFVRKLIVQ